MSPLSGTLVFCIILSFATSSQGMLFSMDTTPDNVYCGRLQCWADKIFTDTNVSSISGLVVYDVTKSSMPVKLAYLSVYSPVIEQTEFNVTVTGNISWYRAELTVGLRDTSYCLNGSFLCELDFVHFGGQPDVMKETVSPGSSGNCPAVFNQFAQVAIQVKTQADEFEKENFELTQRNEELTHQIVELTHQSGELTHQIVELTNQSGELTHQNAELKQRNTELVTAVQTQSSCVRGMPFNSSREVFLLLGRVAALCDRETDGGGWIIIQRRTKGDVDFYRGWTDYKNGFGNPATDFWIGNDIIYHLTTQGYTELRVDVEYNAKHYYAHYSQFTVTDESSYYRLSVSGYSGTAGENLAWQDGMNFSTFDKDNDADSTRNCASRYQGAWWYRNCYASNLNGLWAVKDDTGAAWTSVTGLNSVSFSEMKVRHV